MRTRRGFTLVELLIALVLLSLVTASLFSLLNTTQRVSRAQSERSSLQSNVRTGAIVIPGELRQINTVTGGTTDQNDIVAGAMTATSIQYRAMRGMGLVCQVPTSTEVRIFNNGANPFMGYRNPAAPRDGLYVFVENNADKSSDDAWVRATVTAVASGNVCPGGVAGYTFTVSPAVAGLTSATINAPVRTWELMTLQLYQSNGEWWLGAQSNSAGEAMQPVLGPLRSGNGLGFEYFNSAGATTADVKQVRSIRVTIRGLSDQAVVSGAGSTNAVVGDSIVTQVVLRNALR
jgi:prepilin-type N-terminal cleavage/methylation domain-containing protein